MSSSTQQGPSSPPQQSSYSPGSKDGTPGIIGGIVAGIVVMLIIIGGASCLIRRGSGTSADRTAQDTESPPQAEAGPHFPGIDQFTAFPTASTTVLDKGHRIRDSIRLPHALLNTSTGPGFVVPYIDTTQDVVESVDSATLTNGETDNPSQIPYLLERLNRAIARLPPNNTLHTPDSELPPEYQEL